jgi:acyl-CoA reductase-like NAD-dependent aldehyde dehydrogenase
MTGKTAEGMQMTETSKVDALVKRLREAYDWTTVEPYSDRRTALEAADLLEQLAANIEALTAQLAEDADVLTWPI